MSPSNAAPEVLAHLEWIGFVQPTGLVVSAPALVRAGAVLDRRDVQGQHLLASCVAERTVDPEDVPEPYIPDFEEFARSVLGWTFSSKFYSGTADSALPAELEVVLPEFEDTLRPDYAVREPEPNKDGSQWQLLVKVLEKGTDFDAVYRGNGLEASAHGRMERLLRDRRVLAGVLFNGSSLRLISAPRGESSGWFDVHVADMLTTAGRPICTALRLLLSENRLLSLPRGERLTALLEDSRRYQNEVSERLAEQVLHALYELLRGFQAANDASGGRLLEAQLRDDPDAVNHGLLTVLLRLVFLLYAEERGMLPEDQAYVRFYSLGGLHERLRADAALYPDTMDQRFGSWAQLLTLFRMVYDGATTASLSLPARHGVLFDPGRFPFLEGRSAVGSRQIHERIAPPLVPDGTVYRVLEQLLVLDGERISYRALDVEQIGSVYETMVGFRMETATGRSLAIRPTKRLGAPVTIDLDALLATPPEKREAWLTERTDRKISSVAKKAVKSASTFGELHAALDGVIDRDATPDIVAPGSMILQPSQERRRSGSHYTPRSLTEPIVRTALAPILRRLSSGDGVPPMPDAILDLKVCDPAMGSGAFLVETCRQLAEALLQAWVVHGGKPGVPPDEDEVIFARRLVAQRCLYGVDRNPVAVDLAKMSLWLATLAREHPLTFVDHALKHGDSLAGLTIKQIEAFHWSERQAHEGRRFVSLAVHKHLEQAAVLRDAIRNAADFTPEENLSELLGRAEDELARATFAGDLVVAAFFSGGATKAREATLGEFAGSIERGDAERHQILLDTWRGSDPPLVPFHWELEFPEVFEREAPGFDAVVGNPPFAGKNTMATGNVEGYSDWLKQLHEHSHGNSDIVAHFFRRAFNLLREGGTLGLIATNTIAQGDTRTTGLRWICSHAGRIYNVQRRLKWPGTAAVVVSVVHVAKGPYVGTVMLDSREVDSITAFLSDRGGNDDPVRLAANSDRSYQGSIVLGMGFTFDDTDTKGVATSIAEMNRLLAVHPACREVIFPYIGGEEVNTSPAQAHDRYVINFGERSEKECLDRWPELMAIVEAKVLPERLAQNDAGARAKWWQFIRPRPELQAAIAGLEMVLVVNCGATPHLALAFLPAQMVFANSLVVFPFSTRAAFCALQARPHEVWARCFGSSMKDDLRYTPSDCFETFPFPQSWEVHDALEVAGAAYYGFRANLMVRNGQGLTETYNRFHDPDELDADILKLRDLHDAMDRAVLDAYGWQDLAPSCEFLLDFEIQEEDWGRKKKPYRYRWSDDAQAEILARLLELNAERAAQESQVGAGAARQPARKLKGRTVRGPDPETLELNLDA